MNRGVFAALAAVLLAFSGCRNPPQIGADREAFKVVDALYTAVGLRDAAMVDRCGEKLREFRDASKLSEAAFAALESIIAEAKGGRWEPAQERLSRFMEGQRPGA